MTQAIINSSLYDSLPLREAATYMGMHYTTLQQLARSSKVKGSKHGKQWRFIRADLIEYMRTYKSFKEEGCNQNNLGKGAGTGIQTYGSEEEELESRLASRSKNNKKQSNTAMNLKLVSGKNP